MAGPLFRMVCIPAALDGAPAGWAAGLLEDGEVALLVDDGGLDSVSAVAHALDLVTVAVVRAEQTDEQQERTVMDYAARLPLVWVASTFGERVRAWARERGPMTLLVEAAGALGADERRRTERFVATLGRQAE